MKFGTKYNLGMLNAKLKSNFENSRNLLFYCPFFCSSINNPLFWINLLKRRQIRYKWVQETICIRWVQKWCQSFEIHKTYCFIVYPFVLLLTIHCFNRLDITPPKLIEIGIRNNLYPVNSKLTSNFLNSWNAYFYCLFFCSIIDNPLFLINLLKRPHIWYKNWYKNNLNMLTWAQKTPIFITW